MKKRQKLILIIYFYAALFLGFVYVPYIRHYQDGTQQFIGHTIRSKFWNLLVGEQNFAQSNLFNMTIDANLIIAELLAITAMAAAVFLFFNRDK